MGEPASEMHNCWGKDTLHTSMGSNAELNGHGIHASWLSRSDCFNCICGGLSVRMTGVGSGTGAEKRTLRITSSFFDLVLYWSLESEVFNIEGTLLVVGASASTEVGVTMKLVWSGAIHAVATLNSVSEFFPSVPCSSFSRWRASFSADTSSTKRTCTGSDQWRFHRTNSATIATQTASEDIEAKTPVEERLLMVMLGLSEGVVGIGIGASEEVGKVDAGREGEGATVGNDDTRSDGAINELGWDEAGSWVPVDGGRNVGAIGLLGWNEVGFWVILEGDGKVGAINLLGWEEAGFWVLVGGGRNDGAGEVLG
jgi:hypothetical protein